MKRFIKQLALGILLPIAFIGPVFAQAIYSYQYINITGQATTTLNSRNGYLHSICFNNPVATSVITLYDSLTTAGGKIGTITIPASPQPFCLIYDIQYGTGLTVVTATASSDITIAYR